MAVILSDENARGFAAAQAGSPPGRRTSLYAIAAGSISAHVRPQLTWLIDLLAAWRQCVAERRGLAELGDYYLKDLGLSREDVAADWRRDVRLW